MPLRAGRKNDLPSDFAESMAHAMIIAFKNAWKEFKGECPPMISENYLKPLFIGIAQGVVKHLSDNADAFYVKVVQKSPRIESSGESDDATYYSSESYDYYEHHHTITTVTQKDGFKIESDNLDVPESVVIRTTPGDLFESDECAPEEPEDE